MCVSNVTLGMAQLFERHPIFLVLSYCDFRSKRLLCNVISTNGLSLLINELKATGVRKVGPIAYLTQDSEFRIFFYMNYFSHSLLLFNLHRLNLIIFYLVQHTLAFLLFLSCFFHACIHTHARARELFN